MKKNTQQHTHSSSDPMHNSLQGMRVDKWLWAARFFKTRSLAKEAIEGGKVHFDGNRVKVSKEVQVGMELTIRQGFDEKTVIIKALSEVRGGAPQAQLLYEETPHSIAKREFYSSQRKLANLARPDHRPNKRERRHINNFKQENSMSYSSKDEGF
jgi:ribosome-associated heat shock protein Hsp15